MARVKVTTFANKPLDQEMKKVKKYNDKKNIKKSKPKKKDIPLGPKLRLEPRLSPIKSSKCSEDNAVEKTSTEQMVQSKKSCNFSSSNVLFEGIKLPDTIKFESDNTVLPDISSYGDNTYKSVRNKIDYLKATAVSAPVTTSSTKVKWKPRLKMKTKMRKARFWHDRELLNLAIGLQTHGFKETKKIAELIKTKNENQVYEYVRLRSVDVRAEISAEKLPVADTQTEPETDTDSETNKETKKHEVAVKHKGRPRNKWAAVSSKHLPSWPNIRKWKRLAFDQMLALSKTKDYSKIDVTALIQRFYDEEEEPSDPQVINVKAVYKYLMDCLAGEIPPQLPSKESALVMDLLRDLRLLPMVYDFDEETKFLESYKEATRYKPFQVKDEFKKRFIKTENTEDGFSPNCVSVPEDVFTNLSRHKKVVQSFNPLMIPVWMMQKEQEYMEQFV